MKYTKPNWQDSQRMKNIVK